MNSVKHELFKVAVLKLNRISKSSVVIQLPKYASFKAGQVINITSKRSIPPRMYSIASGEHEEYIEILLKIVPDGELTPLLDELKEQDSLWVSNPFGGFLATNDPACLIATGTGIAPFLSMIRSGYTKNKLLLHGSRDVQDFYYSDYLSNKMESSYIKCYTGSEACTFYKGRVTHYLLNLSLIDTHIKYYLCGSVEMVVEVRQILIDRGVSFKNILSEIYF